MTRWQVPHRAGPVLAILAGAFAGAVMLVLALAPIW